MNFSTNFNEVKASYNYPEGLDLRPGSELHEFIVKEVTKRARISRDSLQNRFDVWRDIDRTLNVYVDLSTAEKAVKDKDKRKPVSIVVPTSYATMQVLLTYMMAAFLDNPVFRYESVQDKDEVSAILLQHVINLHVRKLNVALGLHTMWRDAFAYGFGVAVPEWTTEEGMITVEQANPAFLSELGAGVEIPGTPTMQRVKGIRFEGNSLSVIDPYHYLPDPDIPINEPQAGEFVGWVVRSNITSLLRKEGSGNGQVFNAAYVKAIGGDKRSSYYDYTESGRYDKTGITGSMNGQKNDSTDTIYMYIDIIPSDWMLGDSDYPEKWLFAVTSDKVVTSAQPLGLNHGKFPVVVNAPEYDGHSLVPISKLEVVHGLQEAINWLYSSHVTNVRKAINDMLIYDPTLVNSDDLKNPEPGKLIRMRRVAFGRGVIDEAVKQLNVQDVTSGHLGEIGMFMNISDLVSGAGDLVKGVRRRTSERVTATEASGLMNAALSRLEHDARITALQSHTALGEFFAEHTMQFMSQDVWVKVAGDMTEQLSAEFKGSRKINVTPSMIQIPYEVIPHDGSIPGSGDNQAWVQLFQIMATQPTIGQMFDIGRVFKHIARGLGAKNVDDFVQVKTQQQVMPDQTVQDQLQQGNIAPVTEVFNE